MPVLTVSGNEITDLIRTAARAPWPVTQQGGGMVDPYTPPAGFGIWRPATNQMRTAQCDSTNNWTVNTGVTPTTDPTVPPPWSSQSIKCVIDGSAAGQGVKPQTFGTLALAPATPCVGSILFRGTAGLSYDVRMRIQNTDASTTDGAVTTFTAGAGTWPTITVNGLTWEILTPAAATVAVGKTGDSYGIRVGVAAAITRADTLWVAHPMLESGQTDVAPYVPTSGGATASNGAGRVQLLSALSFLDPTQCWVAARVRMGFPSTSPPSSGGGFQWLLDWRADNNNRMGLFFRDSATNFAVTRLAGGVGSSTSPAASSFNVGDSKTVIGSWTATLAGTSVDGGAFSTAGNNTIPVIGAGVNADIGSSAGSGQLDSDYLWVVIGKGVLTDADAATLNAFGDTPPALSKLGLPAAAQPTLVWNAVTNSFDSGLDSVQRQLLGVGI